MSAVKKGWLTIRAGAAEKEASQDPPPNPSSEYP
jgi:hypothetical protein